MVQHASVDSKPSNQIRLWPENVDGLRKTDETKKMSLNFLANMTIQASLKARDRKAKAKQK